MKKIVIRVGLLILGAFLVVLGLSKFVNSDILGGITTMVLGVCAIMLSLILEDYDQWS